MNCQRTWRLVAALALAVCGAVLPAFGESTGESATIKGFADLKFGMTQEEVQALPACSSATECLYEILGKNRYINLTYSPPLAQPNGGEPTSSSAVPHLTTIDIDMGRFQRDWYADLHHMLAAQYPLTHQITPQQHQLFATGQRNELVVGFADAQVLLKVYRRPYGNLIIRVIYQSPEAAQKTRQHWAATGSP